MRKIDRLSKYIEFKGLNDNIVTKECSLSQGLINQARSGKCDLGAKTIEKILEIYQDLNRVWLITGEGPMIKEKKFNPIEDTTFLSLINEIDNIKPVKKQGEEIVRSLESTLNNIISAPEETIASQKQLIVMLQAEVQRLQRAIEEKEGKTL